jgi:hypothetical protein
LIIGENLYYLDFNNHVVAVTDKPELKEDILKNNFEDPTIKLFGFEDDVLDLVQTNAESTVEKSAANSGILTYDLNAPTIVDGCGWDKCDNNGDSKQHITGSTSNGSSFQYRLEAKHVYQAAGIFFRLFSEAKHMRRPSGSTLTFNSEPTTIYIIL